MTTRRPEDVPKNLSLLRVVLGGARYVVIAFDSETSPERARRTLTAAESAVLELALLDLSNADIARRRRTSPRTVANQIASAFRKLGVTSRRELFARLARPR